MMTVNLNDAIGYAYDMTGEIHIMMTVNLNDAIGYAYDIIYLLKNHAKRWSSSKKYEY